MSPNAMLKQRVVERIEPDSSVAQEAFVARRLGALAEIVASPFNREVSERAARQMFEDAIGPLVEAAVEAEGDIFAEVIPPARPVGNERVIRTGRAKPHL